MPSASAPSVSPSGRSCGEPVMGDPPIDGPRVRLLRRQPGFTAHYGLAPPRRAIGSIAHDPKLGRQSPAHFPNSR
jgi:hypothetical protein